jgi:hypothetical protein
MTGIKPQITRKEFAEENRRMRILKRHGWREEQIKGWLRGWRQVGFKLKQRNHQE